MNGESVAIMKIDDNSIQAPSIDIKTNKGIEPTMSNEESKVTIHTMNNNTPYISSATIAITSSNELLESESPKKGELSESQSTTTTSSINNESNMIKGSDGDDRAHNSTPTTSSLSQPDDEYMNDDNDSDEYNEDDDDEDEDNNIMSKHQMKRKKKKENDEIDERNKKKMNIQMVRYCTYENCKNKARGKGTFCIRHGGGTRCVYEGCIRGARDKLRLCMYHGGGNRCTFDGCTKGAVGGVFCIRHGGGKRCSIDSCSRAVSRFSTFCSFHTKNPTLTQSISSISNSSGDESKSRKVIAKIPSAPIVNSIIPVPLPTLSSKMENVKVIEQKQQRIELSAPSNKEILEINMPTSTPKESMLPTSKAYPIQISNNSSGYYRPPRSDPHPTISEQMLFLNKSIDQHEVKNLLRQQIGLRHQAQAALASQSLQSPYFGASLPPYQAPSSFAYTPTQSIQNNMFAIQQQNPISASVAIQMNGGLKQLNQREYQIALQNMLLRRI